MITHSKQPIILKTTKVHFCLAPKTILFGARRLAKGKQCATNKDAGSLVATPFSFQNWNPQREVSSLHILEMQDKWEKGFAHCLNFWDLRKFQMIFPVCRLAGDRHSSFMELGWGCFLGSCTASEVITFPDDVSRTGRGGLRAGIERVWIG